MIYISLKKKLKKTLISFNVKFHMRKTLEFCWLVSWVMLFSFFYV